MKINFIFFFSGVFSTGIVVIFLYFILMPYKPQQNTKQQSSFPYISQQIFEFNPNDILINFTSLRTTLNDYMTKIPDSVSLYFEYLPSGVSIGINEKQESQLVSLLKVPVVIAVYKNIELGKIHKTNLISLQKEDLDNSFGTLWKQGAGSTITVQEAITQMLVNSDNTAKNVLGHLLTNDDVLNVFNSLDIPLDTQNESPVVSAKNYSSILKSLYFSSYLTAHDSNEILNILTKSHFNDEIAKPIPQTIPVAHKIGVLDIADNNSTPLYDDCGIIYIPERPYILCIMTKAKQQNALPYMQDLSKIIYTYVSQVNQTSQ